MNAVGDDVQQPLARGHMVRVAGPDRFPGVAAGVGCRKPEHAGQPGFPVGAVRGQQQAARELGEDTLARRRRVLGEDHPDTLASADNLVILLGRVGEDQAARELAEDILARRRRVLGDDHPDTMMAAAFDLILRGLDIGGEPSWMAAIREAHKRPGS